MAPVLRRIPTTCVSGFGGGAVPPGTCLFLPLAQEVCNVRRIRLLQASVESEDKLREMEEGSVWFDIYSGCCIMVNESPSPTVSRGFPNALSGPDARLQ